MSSEADTGTHPVAKASTTFMVNNPTSIKSLDFFIASCFFVGDLRHDDNGSWTPISYHCFRPDIDNTETIPSLASEKREGNGRSPLPEIWISADNLAKVFYSTILADLGQDAPQNILAEPNLLASFSSNIPATIGLYISYGLPILIGLIWHKSFISMKGPFDLGMFSRPIAFVACTWIAFMDMNDLCHIRPMRMGSP